jgi:hypothetical protein
MIPNGNSVTPPNLPADTPILDILDPVFEVLEPPFGPETDLA